MNGASVTEGVRVLVADDQQSVLEAISELLAGEFQVVAAAQDGERAVEAAGRLNPDLLLLDISMPVLSGIEAAAQLKLKESPRAPKLIFVTVHEDPDYVEAAFAVGARGYEGGANVTNKPSILLKTRSREGTQQLCEKSALTSNNPAYV